MREPIHGYIDTGEVGLHYVDWPGPGPAILCVPGLTGNARGFDGVADSLAGRCRVVALDVRGRGLSDKPPTGQYGWSAHARDTAAVIRALDLGPAILLGHSMGAYISALVAAERPELVARVILMDGGNFPREISKEELRAQGRASLQRLSARYASFEEYVDYWKRTGIVKPWSEYFEAMLAADLAEQPDGTFMCRLPPHGIEQDRKRPVWAPSFGG